MSDKKNPETEGYEHNKFANASNRNFYAEKPMQKVVTYVTYIKNKGKWHYFACYLDLFNSVRSPMMPHKYSSPDSVFAISNGFLMNS